MARKIFIGILAFIICVSTLMLAGCGDKNGAEKNKEYTFSAVVENVADDGTLRVACISAGIPGIGKYEFSTAGVEFCTSEGEAVTDVVSEIKIGDKLHVTFKGEVLEVSPAQIKGVTKIVKVN